MNRALSYGLMGAASGFLGGLYDEVRQNQADQRSERLAQAEYQEKVQLLKLQQQFNSATNLQKVQAQMQADMTRDAANNQAKASLQSQSAAAKAQEDAANNAAAEKRAQISAGATLGAAKIRAAAETSKTTVAAPPTKAILTALGEDDTQTDPNLVQSSKVRALARYKAAVNSGAKTPDEIMNWATQHPPIGRDMDAGDSTIQPTVQNPADAQTAGATNLNASAPAAPQYPDGTRLMGPGGKTYVVKGGVPVPVGG